MKKKIYLLIFILLFTSGCTCQYNLKISDNTFSETIYLVGSTTEESNDLNNTWSIPVYKDANYSGDRDTDYTSAKGIYDYTFSNNTLKFTHDFKRGDFASSTAVSTCYKTFTMTNYQGNDILSTNSVADCFDAYPYLTSININVTLDKKVISHDADSVNGNTYTWKLNRSNYKNKAVNLIYEQTSKNKETEGNKDTDNPSPKKKDYGMFIFAGILLIIALIVYAIFIKLKKENDEMDD